MVINLFLDANIFLSFYALSNSDISQLSQLSDVVKKGDIKLLVSDQLSNEIERNREKKAHESLETLRKEQFRCHAASFVRPLPEFVKLQDVLKDANKKHSEMVYAAEALVKNRGLKADTLIDNLIQTAGITATSLEQFGAAHRRYLRGDPPGKKEKTIGDELNWEFLLEVVPPGERLHLVTNDKDYASPIDLTKINSFLLLEWKKSKSSEIFFYKDLNIFLKSHLPNIKLANQEKLNFLISELAGSGTYFSTHTIIAKFTDDADFNDSQVVELMSIKENNSQVGAIENDADIAAFYAPIAHRYAQIIDKGENKAV